MWGRGPRGTNGACSALCQFSVTPSTTHNPIGLFWRCFPCGWVCVRCRPLWVSPTTSPVRLGVSVAAASTPTGVFSQWFEALFPCTGALGSAVCHPVHQLLPRWPAAALPPPSLAPQSTSLLGSPASALPQVLSTPAACLCPSYLSG